MNNYIQATNLITSDPAAVLLDSGDTFYELAGVSVIAASFHENDNTGIFLGGTGASVYLNGAVFGSELGIRAAPGAAISLTVSATGNLLGGKNGVELGAIPSISSLKIDGALAGDTGFAVISTGSSQIMVVQVGKTGTVSGSTGGIKHGGPGRIQVDGRVATIDGDGISMTGKSTIFVTGIVSGGNTAVFNSNTTAFPATITVASGGVLSGGVYGLYAIGSHLISNAGTISSLVGDGLRFDGGGYVVNTGAIVGHFGGILAASNTAADSLVIVNTGTISGSQHSYLGASLHSERLINEGVMNGDVQLADHADSSFVNAGKLNGGVTLGAGAGQMLDSTFGDIGGPITCGAGGDIVVAGRNGGTVQGGAGNDVLYANQTQAAADAAVHTTLDGGAGINALYGGGGWNTFISGNAGGGYNQIWGGASRIAGVAGTTNNTLSFAASASGVFVDILSGHNAYVAAAGSSWTGAGTYKDSIVNVPNIVGSGFGDVIQADNGVDRITGGVGADALYAGSGPQSQDTFVYMSNADSNLVTGYDTIVGFKLASDRIDLTAFHTDGTHVAISTAGTSNTVYWEVTPGTFNANTDLALIVNTATTGGLTAANFIF